ncbi:MAG: hypothetical protein WC861_07135 [Candidatus Micrarchaeia archaeon]|jgi:hypothetical protein
MLRVKRQIVQEPGGAAWEKSFAKRADSTAKQVKARLGRPDMRNALEKIKNDDLKGALGALNAAVRKKPGDAVALALRHYTRELLGDEKGSNSDFAKVNRISPATFFFVIKPMVGDAETPLMRTLGIAPKK